MKPVIKQKRKAEASFTLLETVIALGLMVTVILEVSSIQGKSITFGEYNRKVLRATWLAQSVMAQVERGHRLYNFSEIKSDVKNQTFDEALCSKDPAQDCDFTYDLLIEPFDLDIAGLITKKLVGSLGAPQSGADGSSEGGGAASGMKELVESQIKNYMGDEILKIAQVEVFWPEGSKRNSVTLAYVMANQHQLDVQILQQPALVRAPDPTADPRANPGGREANRTGAGGTLGPAGPPTRPESINTDPDPENLE